MGAISPAPALNQSLNREIFNNIIMPTVHGMKSEGHPYEGILYAGIMVTDKGPKVIEFNCRFGDPETQVVLPRLNTDLVKVVQRTISKNLKNMAVDFIPQKAITVVIASNGYPGEFEKGIVLPSLNEFNNKTEISVFHSGTKKDENENLVSNGGRVLSITSIGDNIQECRKKAYSTLDTIDWKQGFYRKDIGKV